MLKILKLFLLKLLIIGNLCHATTIINSDKNSSQEQDELMHQIDICKFSDGLEWPLRILRFPLKFCTFIFKNRILEETKYLTSRFRFKLDTPVYGLENTKGTCYEAALFQALKASAKFVSFINYIAAEED